MTFLPPIACFFALLAPAAEPITPGALQDALQVPPRGAGAEALAARIRASFPAGTDLKAGKHAPLIDQDTVAFVLEAPAGSAPRVTGMLDHSRGFDLVPIGETGLWARVESIPTDTKFAFAYEADGKKVGTRVVEMPDWSYPPESKERPGGAYGKYVPLTFRSEVFRNNRTGWVYVPAAYAADGPPAALMVFQDGDAYKGEHVGTVVDNLIAAKAMPVTILVLLNPGVNDDGKGNRSVEYDSLDDAYVRFLDKEVLPRVKQEYQLSDDPARHAIGGASSGGICAFTAAWHRPDLFGKVCSQIGSFTAIRGGNAYPERVRKDAKRPIKVLLSDGTNDLINQHGDWWQANEAMDAALRARGYEVRFLKDRGFHAYWTCGRQLPEALRWLWADGKR